MDSPADAPPWSEGAQGENSTLLYIAVEYVKPSPDYKIETDTTVSLSPAPPTAFPSYEDHVSPLDPNMSSVARYSPVYPEPEAPVIVQQLLPAAPQNQSPESQRFIDSSERGEENQYLRMMPGESPTEGLLCPEGEQEVELLITDQATGISYSVSTQEFLVEDEQRLLDAFVPGPLMDTELLALDDAALKSQLMDAGMPVLTQCPDLPQTGDVFPTEDVKQEKEDQEDVLRRSKRQIEISEDEGLLRRIYSISDKPFVSRARATLPEMYLVISKQNEEYGVFARKLIPKRTQFGPLEGALIPADKIREDDDRMIFFVESVDGSVTALDISDENCANWMCFVRRAKTYAEINLLLNQQGNHLYYITTKNITPKQELLVDYSPTYAERHGLTALKPDYKDENPWPCFECNERFPSSDHLQKHLNLHDDVTNENVRPKKKHLKFKKKVFVKSNEQCFVRKQLKEYSGDANKSNTINTLKCNTCKIAFLSEDLLKLHQLHHDDTATDDEPTPRVCPVCHRKFTTRKQLLAHAVQHNPQTKGYKCTSCYKTFPTLERIQRHSAVHGSDDAKPLQCTTCKKRFLTKSALACHLKIHLVGMKMFACPMCEERFDHVLELKGHVEAVHCKNGEYSCPHCSKVFKKYIIIRKHVRAFHRERVHGCGDCGKSFPTVDKLRVHLLKHSDKREFLCADCGKQFKRKDKLKEHCKRMHSEERENAAPKKVAPRKFMPRVQPTEYHRFIYKCHACTIGFKRRGMLVNHLAKRHPDIQPDSVPELNLPILRTTRDYYCQYCDKVYKSSSKRKAHILKNHPGAALPLSNRRTQGASPDHLPNATYSQTVGTVTTRPQNCKWCHKQYASKAKLLQHQRKKHSEAMRSEGEEKRRMKTKVEEIEENNVVDEWKDDDGGLEEEFKGDFKVSDDELISEIIDLNENKEATYYQLESVGVTDSAFNLPPNDINSSRLYSLLATSSGIPQG